MSRFTGKVAVITGADGGKRPGQYARLDFA